MPKKAENEEVTLYLLEGNWKAVVNGDFFRPSFHLFNNEVSYSVVRKLALLSWSGVIETLMLQLNLHEREN